MAHDGRNSGAAEMSDSFDALESRRAVHIITVRKTRNVET